MTKVTQLLTVAAIVTMSATSAFAQAKGTLSAYDGRKEFTLKTADGKEQKGEISGSRTKVTIKGAEADRGALKVGMTCTVTGAGAEVTVVACD
jgi:hypothetical protein